MYGYGEEGQGRISEYMGVGERNMGRNGGRISENIGSNVRRMGERM